MTISQQIEQYMEEWLKTEDSTTMECWLEVKDAVIDSVSKTKFKPENTNDTN